MKYLTWLLVMMMAFASLATAEEANPADAEESATVAEEAGIDEPAQAEEPAPAAQKTPSKSRSRKAKAAPATEAEEPVVADKPAETPKEIPVRPVPAPVVQSAPASRFSLGMSLGYWNAKDLEDFELGGFIGGGVVGQYRLRPNLALEFRLGGYAAGASEDVFVESAGWFENTTTLVVAPIEAGLVGFFPIHDQFTAYVGGGVGFYLLDGEFTSEQGRWKQTYDMSIDSEVGFYGLVGARYQIAPNAALFLEAKYTVLEASLKDDLSALLASDRTGEIPFGQDVDLGGIGIQAGAIFSF